MKILNSFRFLRGMSTDKGSTPALVPPDRQNVLKSISIFQSVDILCEGPIYGLVDQFGKKVYGLDMLKGIYLNKIPVMNVKGEYNYRNILMEINLGTENQNPLVNFKEVNIFKPSNFKILGPIKAELQPDETRYHPDNFEVRDFVSWARGANGWPSTAQDPYTFVHHIKNKDVKKIKIGLLVENLFDTVDRGESKGKAGKMGMSRSSYVNFNLIYGVEGTKNMIARSITISGTVNSPYATMIGEDRNNFNAQNTNTTSNFSRSSASANPSNLPNSSSSNSRSNTADYSNQALSSLNRVSGATIPLTSILFYLDPGNKASFQAPSSYCYNLVGDGQGLISGAQYFGPNRPNFTFDGTDDRIRFNSSIFNKPFAGKTVIIAGRLNADLANDSFKALWGTDSGASRNFGTYIYRNSSGQYSIHFSTGAAGSISGTFSGFVPMVIGQWFVVTVTQAANGSTTYYFNGNNSGYTGSAISGFSQFVETTYEFIGYYASQYWNGSIGDVIIYKEALSSTDVLRVNSIIKQKFGIS